LSTERDILARYKTIAVAGLSADPERPSHWVAHYLQEQGYRIIPVNPREREILGEKCYPDLCSVPEEIDVVDIFRASRAVPRVVAQAMYVSAKAVWMQEGVVHEAAAARARRAGMAVVMDRCMMKEHKRMMGKD
jgi:predicted CoA-binding protein